MTFRLRAPNAKEVFLNREGAAKMAIVVNCTVTFYKSGVVGDDRDFYVYTPAGYNVNASAVSSARVQ